MSNQTKPRIVKDYVARQQPTQTVIVNMPVFDILMFEDFLLSIYSNLRGVTMLSCEKYKYNHIITRSDWWVVTFLADWSN